MKKYIFLSILAGITVASCSQDEVQDARPVDKIEFNVSNAKVSRGTPLFGESPLKGSGFNVSATFNRDYSKNYFTDQTFKFNGKTYAPTNGFYYPWPNSGRMEFNAYRPTDIKESVDVENGILRIHNYKPEVEMSDQYDVCVAFNYADCENHPSSVDLMFNHIMAGVQVRAYNMNPDVRIEVKGVKLANFGTNSTFTSPTYTIANGGRIDAITYWSTPTEKTSYGYMLNETGVMEEYPHHIGLPKEPSFFFVIPQVLKPWDGTANDNTGAYIAVLCRISVKTTGGVFRQLYPSQTGKFAWVAVPVPNEMISLMPQRYYYLSLYFCNGADGGCGLVAPDHTNPLDPSDSSIAPDPLKKAGDPVLGGPIKINVIKHSWDDNKGDTDVVNN